MELQKTVNMLTYIISWRPHRR